MKLKTDIGLCAVNSPEVYPVCLPEQGTVLPDWTECEISGYGKDTECEQLSVLKRSPNRPAGDSDRKKRTFTLNTLSSFCGVLRACEERPRSPVAQ